MFFKIAVWKKGKYVLEVTRSVEKHPIERNKKLESLSFEQRLMVEAVGSNGTRKAWGDSLLTSLFIISEW